MIKVDTFTYRVERKEVITLKIALIGLGEKMVRVSKAMQPVPGQALTWEMTIPSSVARKYLP